MDAYISVRRTFAELDERPTNIDVHIQAHVFLISIFFNRIINILWLPHRQHICRTRTLRSSPSESWYLNGESVSPVSGSSEGCGFDPRLVVRNRLSEIIRAWLTFYEHLKIQMIKSDPLQSLEEFYICIFITLYKTSRLCRFCTLRNTLHKGLLPINHWSPQTRNSWGPSGKPASGPRHHCSW